MRSTLVIFLVTSIIQTFAQSFTTDNYYLFPINPGQQNYLAGTMGELRASHFHAGLDIKTGGRTGLPVHVAANGFVSRIKVSTSGYGQVLYVTHANGTTSVYAHLDRFQEDIAEYVLEKQYKEESFTIELFPPSYMFPFQQGEIIAYSGNTGSSSGPHLHFEIRDKNQRILDPLKFNFKEIKDNISPQIRNIAFVTLDGNARVNGTFGRFEFELLKADGVYKTRVPIALSGNIGIEVYAYDLLNEVHNRNGISKTTLAIDGDTIFMENKTRLAFNQQRDILAHMDYEGYRKNGVKYNKLFVDDGNHLDFYKRPSKGFYFSDKAHEIKIFMEDSYGNISALETGVNTRKVVNKPDPLIDEFDIYRNHMHFKAPYGKAPSQIRIFLGRASREIAPYRVDRQVAYYLWDLRKGLPDSVDYCGKIIPTNIYAEIPSGSEINFYNHSADLFFSKRDLFDTLYLQFKKSYDDENKLELFQFLNTHTPLRSNVKIALKPELTYPTQKARVYSKYGNRLSYVGGWWKNGEITFNTRNFGTFTIAEDSIPPIITPKVVSTRVLQFKISDGLSGIKSYRATLDGKFLLMKYEHKRHLIWAQPKKKNTPMKGEFILQVEDNTGNVTQYKKNL